MKTRTLLAAAVLVLSGCDGGSDPPPERGRLADCSTGPWAEHCPEARWARDVAEAGGFDVTGDTGSALTIEGSGQSFHLWAFTPEQPRLRDEQLVEEGYDQETSVGGVRVYGDGIRATWKVYGLHVWLANARAGDMELSAPGVAAVVKASAEVPWP